MRVLLPLLALGLLAACTGPQQVAATPPSVAYRVAGNDISRANLSAAQYCRQYALVAQLQEIQPTATGNVATYLCRTAP